MRWQFTQTVQASHVELCSICLEFFFILFVHYIISIRVTGSKGHLCLRRVFSLITKLGSESFDFPLPLLLSQVVCMESYIIMFDHRRFT